MPDFLYGAVLKNCEYWGGAIEKPGENAIIVSSRIAEDAAMKRKTALLLLLAFLAALTVSFRVSGGQAETGPTAPEQSAAPENTPVQPPLPEPLSFMKSFAASRF